MEFFLIFFLLFLLLGFVRVPRGTEGAQPPEQTTVLLKTEEGREFVEWNGCRYFAYEGETDPDSGVQVWDWHGRMGDEIGFLLREGARMPAGELYHLRGNGEILLGFLPEDGWPITDMKLFIREGETLPEIAPEAFDFAEIYRIQGAFQEEEYEKIRDSSDGEWISSLIQIWLSGESADLPEAEYDRYRVRVYSAAYPGLYVNVTVNVNELHQCFGVEKYRFSGDALLSPQMGARFLK